jgi:hypothetical protein
MDILENPTSETWTPWTPWTDVSAYQRHQTNSKTDDGDTWTPSGSTELSSDTLVHFMGDDLRAEWLTWESDTTASPTSSEHQQLISAEPFEFGSSIT